MPPKKNPTPVESVKHQDRRVNIPGEELGNFVREDELRPEAMLYPRDPSLDSQLVWRGKDEQNRDELAVPVVPIYIRAIAVKVINHYGDEVLKVYEVA